SEDRIAPLARPGFPAPRPVAPRPERIAKAPAATVQGQVVGNDRATPRSDVQLVFVRAEDQATAQTVAVDRAGRFAVKLASGNWQMYERTADGQSVWHSELTIRPNEDRNVRVVSR